MRILKGNRGWVRTGQFSWSGAPSPPASDLSTRLNAISRTIRLDFLSGDCPSAGIDILCSDENPLFFLRGVGGCV